MVAQKSTQTYPDRYPGHFVTAKAFFAQIDNPAPRILSFGCSTGDEMISLRRYFPESEIFGCDIDIDAAMSRTDLRGSVFLSNPESIASHGSFDLIFANSVLCRYPIPKKRKLSEVFPFSEFESLTRSLHNILNPNGVLAIVNANYFFQELDFSIEYRPVRSPLVVSSGFLPVYSRDYTLVRSYHPSVEGRDWAIEIVAAERMPNAHALSDSLFQKAEGTPVWVPMQGALPTRQLLQRMINGT